MNGKNLILGLCIVLSILILTPSIKADVYDNVSLYYDFNGDTITTKCGDRTGGNNNCSVPSGTGITSPTNCSGMSNAGYNFTGIGADINNATLNVSSLNRGINYTLMAWHRPQNVGVTNYLFSTYYDDLNNKDRRGINIYGWNTGNAGSYNITWATNLNGYSSNVEGNKVGSNISVHTALLNTWVFTLWVVDATNDVATIYIGNQTDLSNWTAPVNTSMNNASRKTSFYIGNKIIDFYLTAPFLEQPGGAMDEVAFWNRTLTDVEILSLWNDSDGYFYNQYVVAGTNEVPVVNSMFLNATTNFNYTNHTLYCYFNITDADNSTVWANYTWYVDDVVNWTGSVSMANNTEYNLTIGYVNTTKGEDWRCNITPHDEKDYGTSGETNNLTIENTPPDILAILLSSIGGNNYVNETLNCSADIHDNDGDNMNVTINWTKTGVFNMSIDHGNYTNGTIFNTTLGSDNTTIDDVWNCSVLLKDGTSNSSVAWSNSLTILTSTPNNAPTTPSTQSPSNNSAFFEATNITCTGSTDADSDPINYTFRTSQFSKMKYSYDVYTASTSGTQYGLGSSYDIPYSLNTTAGDDVWATTTVGVNTDNLTINILDLDEGVGLDIEIYLNNTMVYDLANANDNTNISINTTLWNDGNSYVLNFSMEETGAGAGKLSWWGEWDYTLDDVYSTNLSFYEVNVTGITDWSCRAYDGTNYSNYTSKRDIYGMAFEDCWVGNIALNLDFEEENNTGTKVTGAIPGISFTLDSDDIGDYDYSFQNSTEMYNWSFCLNPAIKGLTTTGDISYEKSGTPQRTYSLNELLIGNSTTSKTLYFLGSDDGIYTTFQVINSAETPLSDVTVTVYKQISGSYVEIMSGSTDDAGGVTFWVDPNVQHRFVFVRSGYNTATSYITPTQSSYTQTLTSTTTEEEDNYNLGIEYDITPNLITLNISTIYTFGFDISSSYWNLTEYGFSLINSSSGTVLASTSGGTAGGSALTQNLNTSLYDRITMKYFWTVDGETLNGSYYWNVRNASVGTASLMNFITDIKTFNKSGADDFTRTLIFLFLIVIIVGTLVFFAGDTSFSEYAFMGAIVLLTWLGEFAGLLPVIGQQYFITIVVGLIFLGFVIQDNVR